MTQIRSLFLLSFVCGCAGLNSQDQRASISEGVPPRTARVLVNLYRLPTVRVPVSSQGATLRQVVTQARDNAGVGEVERSILNNAVFLQKFFGIELTDEQKNKAILVAGDECYVLVRGRQRFFFPEVVVYGSCAGRVRVLPGDLVLSIPYNIIDSLWPEETAATKTLTVSVPVFGERIVTPPGDYTGWDDDKIFNLDRFTTSEPTAELRKDQLRPTVVVFTRIGPFVDQVFVPTGDETGTESTGFKDHLPFVPRDGDILEFIRLENHPLIAAALSVPAPPPAPTFGLPDSSESLYRDVHDQSASLLGRIPFVGRIDTVLGNSLRRLVPTL